MRTASRTITISDLPGELREMVCHYLADDPDDLTSLYDTRLDFERAIEEVRYSTQEVVARGSSSDLSCKRLLDAIRFAQNDKATELTGPIRHLKLVFSCAGGSIMSEHFTALMQRNATPALRSVSICVVDVLGNRRLDTRSRRIGEASIDVLKDYDTVLDLIKKRVLQSTAKRAMPVHLSISTCEIYHISHFLRQDSYLEYYGFGVEVVPNAIPNIADVVSQLAFASDTLEDLTIKEPEAYRGGRPIQRSNFLNSGRIDFSNFTQLRRLRVPAAVWFTHGACADIYSSGLVWDNRPNCRPSITRLLPPTLHSLRVDFVRQASVFAVGAGHRYCLRLRYTSEEAKQKMRTAYNWMLELVHASTRPQHLKRFEVVEAKNEKVDQIMDWKMPKELTDAFERADVKFTIKLRDDQPLL